MTQSNARGTSSSDAWQQTAADHSLLRSEVALWSNTSAPGRQINRLFCQLVRESGVHLAAHHCTGLCLLTGISLAAMTWRLTDELLLTAACLPFTLGAVLSLLMFARRRRQQVMRRQVLELTESAASHLASGHNVTDALRAAGESLPDPLRQHVISFIASVPLHHSHPSFTDPRFTQGLPELTLLGTLVDQQTGQGTPLSQSLRHFAARLRKQQQLRQKLATATAAGRLAIALMMCAPGLIFAFYTWQDASYPQRLWQSDTGRLAAFVALFLQLLGLTLVAALLRKVTSLAVLGGRR